MSTKNTGRENNQLVPFTFENHTVRTVVIENKPWFIAKDVCDTLGIWNVTEALPSIRRSGTYGERSQDAIAGRVYSQLAGAENMPIKRINKLMYLLAVEPPILQADIARIIGMSEGSLTHIRKRFTLDEIRLFVKELRINALGSSETYVESYSRVKPSREALPAEGGAI